MKRYIKAAIYDLSNEDAETKMDLAFSPDTSVEMFKQLAEADIRLCVVASPYAPRDVVDKILFDNPNERFLEKVALCLETPPDILDILATNDSVAVRAAVAKNPKVSPKTLSDLSEDFTPAIRWTVAGNISTPVSVLETLSTDYDYNVRGEVADNSSTPPDLVKKLLNDPSEVVRGLAKFACRRRGIS